MKKTILVTGASKGIGKALVQRFCQLSADYTIIALARNQQQLHELQEICGHDNLHTIKFDLSQGDYKVLLSKIKHITTHIDIVVNNAGYLVNRPLMEQTIREVKEQFEVNVLSVIKLLQTLYSFFKKDTHIVNIGSMGGFQGSAKFGGLTAYSASKAALVGLTECLAEEWKTAGIKVNCLAVGAVKTDMLKEAFPQFQAGSEVQEMATFIADFALHQHHFFNGKVLPVSVNTP